MKKHKMTKAVLWTRPEITLALLFAAVSGLTAYFL